MLVLCCKTCGERKYDTEFYRAVGNRTGRLSSCKECVKARVAQHRAANLAKVRKYDRERGALPHRLEANRQRASKYASSTHRREWRKRNPEKCAAVIKLNNAVRDGRVVKPSSCSQCDSRYLIHGHHDDYSRPLEVRWLCHWCHTAHHKAAREAARQAAE